MIRRFLVAVVPVVLLAACGPEGEWPEDTLTVTTHAALSMAPMEAIAGTQDPLPTHVDLTQAVVVYTGDSHHFVVLVPNTGGSNPAEDVTSTQDPLPTKVSNPAAALTSTQDPLPTKVSSSAGDRTSTQDPLPTKIIGPGDPEPDCSANHGARP